MNKYIPGDMVGKYIFRSFDFEKDEAIYERCDRYHPSYFRAPITLDLDRDYARSTLYGLVAWSSTRLTGKHRVSKKSFGRLQRQLTASL